MRRGGGPGALVAAAALGLTGCELDEITVVDFTDVVIAEVFVIVEQDPDNNQARAFLHGAGAGAAPGTRTFDDALVTVTRDDGLVLDFVLGRADECVDSQPEGATGSCFLGDPQVTSQLEAGDELELEIGLGDGGTLFGATGVPGEFQLVDVGSSCRLPPDTLLPLRWSVSAGAWAYVNETSIMGLPEVLADEGIEADDPLYLLGLSISASDTTVVFPSQFGIFDRFDLDQELARRLQRGLPEGATAAVSITAVDRNFVNWARGGNFNPSGQVRVSSLRGDGAGVFAAGVQRELVVIGSSAGGGAPLCPVSEADS